MEDYNIIECTTKEEFYDWLKENHNKEEECYIECKKEKLSQKQTHFII